LDILFDLDGTLTDSRPGILACLKYALLGLGHDTPPDAELERYIGVPLKECFTALMSSGGPRGVDRAISLYRERFSSTGWCENAVYPDIPSVLSSLRDGGATLFVATSKPRIFAERIVRHFELGPHFAAVYGSELDGTRSRKEDLIGHILRAESLSPQITCMVGDRAQDMAGARSHGVSPVGALWGYGSREELLDAGAAALCERPAMLVEVLS